MHSKYYAIPQLHCSGKNKAFDQSNLIKGKYALPEIQSLNQKTPWSSILNPGDYNIPEIIRKISLVPGWKN